MTSSFMWSKNYSTSQFIILHMIFEGCSKNFYEMVTVKHLEKGLYSTENNWTNVFFPLSDSPSVGNTT